MYDLSDDVGYSPCTLFGLSVGILGPVRFSLKRRIRQRILVHRVECVACAIYGKASCEHPAGRFMTGETSLKSFRR